MMKRYSLVVVIALFLLSVNVSSALNFVSDYNVGSMYFEPGSESIIYYVSGYYNISSVTTDGLDNVVGITGSPSPIHDFCMDDDYYYYVCYNNKVYKTVRESGIVQVNVSDLNNTVTLFSLDTVTDNAHGMEIFGSNLYVAGDRVIFVYSLIEDSYSQIGTFPERYVYDMSKNESGIIFGAPYSSNYYWYKYFIDPSDNSVSNVLCYEGPNTIIYVRALEQLTNGHYIAFIKGESTYYRITDYYENGTISSYLYNNIASVGDMIISSDGIIYFGNIDGYTISSITTPDNVGIYVPSSIDSSSSGSSSSGSGSYSSPTDDEDEDDVESSSDSSISDIGDLVEKITDDVSQVIDEVQESYEQEKIPGIIQMAVRGWFRVPIISDAQLLISDITNFDLVEWSGAEDVN
nr:hypothetical protein [uncultured Methanolobus sp.]